MTFPSNRCLYTNQSHARFAHRCAAVATVALAVVSAVSLGFINRCLPSRWGEHRGRPLGLHPSPGHRSNLFHTTQLHAEPGEKFAGLILADCVGSGSFGQTWRARSDGTLRLNGIRVVPSWDLTLKLVQLRDGWNSIDRFQKEARILERLDHPSIPKYLGSVTHDRQNGKDFGLLSRVVKGESLEVCVQSGQWRATPDSVRELARTLLDVCNYLSSFVPPIVHRDIKPANVVVRTSKSRHGLLTRFYLVDFGAAATGTGTGSSTAGTSGFMAPESFSQIFTPKSDLYSVGATLLYAITGREPGSFSQNTLQIQFRRALHGTVWEKEECWLANLLDMLLAPAPEDRPSSAAEALRLLADGSLMFSSPSAAAAERKIITPPRGSSLRAKRRGLDLKVLKPRASTSESLPVLVFAITWVAFTGFWTWGVLKAGLPFMAMFSFPFWTIGVKLLRESFRELFKGAKELRINGFCWSYGQVGCKEPLARGHTQNLRCREGNDWPVDDSDAGHVVLQEGLLEQRIFARLRRAERKWLVRLVSNHVARCSSSLPCTEPRHACQFL